MRILLVLAALFLAAPAHAAEAEIPWTRVAKSGLEDFQASAGGLRLNNLVVRRTDREAAGPASEHEFSATVANRSGAALRVVVQIVGVGRTGRRRFRRRVRWTWANSATSRCGRCSGRRTGRWRGRRRSGCGRWGWSPRSEARWGARSVLSVSGRLGRGVRRGRWR